MMAYRRDEEAGLIRWALNEKRSIWRDCHTLVDVSPNAPFQLPRVLGRLEQLLRDGFFDRRQRYRLSVLGQRLKSGQPTIEFWRHERLPLPLAYLQDAGLRDLLRQAIAAAEDVGQVFRKYAIRAPDKDKPMKSPMAVLAEILLASESDMAHGRDPDGNDVQKLIDGLAVEQAYWAQFEPLFGQFMERLASVPNQEREAELSAWAHVVRNAAFAAFDGATHCMDSSARTLKAVAKATRTFNYTLRLLLTPYQIEEETYEPAQ